MGSNSRSGSPSQPSDRDRRQCGDDSCAGFAEKLDASEIRPNLGPDSSSPQRAAFEEPHIEPATHPAPIKESARENLRFHGIVYKHTNALRRVLISRGAHPDDLDELLQETFAVAWLRRDNIGPGKDKSFLFSTALRLLLAYRRNTLRRRHLDKEYAALPRARNPAARPVDQAAIAKEQKRIVSECLDKLPPRMQQAVRMVHLEGRPVPDAARAMGIAPMTAYHLAERGVKRLRKSLEDKMV